MQTDQPEPPTLMDRFCTAFAGLSAGIFTGFTACLMLIDSGHRVESLKLWILPAMGASLFMSFAPRLILEIARRIRHIRKLKWS